MSARPGITSAQEQDNHRRMTEVLNGKGLEDVVSFEVEVVEEMENDPRTGKFKLIIPFKGE